MTNIELTPYEKTLTIVSRPVQETTPLSDFIKVLPNAWKEKQRFRVENSLTILEPYVGSNRRLGVNVYKALYFEGRRVKGYSKTRLQPNEKVVRLSGTYLLD